MNQISFYISYSWQCYWENYLVEQGLLLSLSFMLTSLTLWCKIKMLVMYRAQTWSPGRLSLDPLWASSLFLGQYNPASSPPQLGRCWNYLTIWLILLGILELYNDTIIQRGHHEGGCLLHYHSVLSLVPRHLSILLLYSSVRNVWVGPR